MRDKSTAPKGDTGGYVLTGVIVTALCAGAVWLAAHPRPLPSRNHPIGMGPGWSCIGNSIKGMGFCMRNGPPDPQVGPQGPPEIPKLSPGPDPWADPPPRR